MDYTGGLLYILQGYGFIVQRYVAFDIPGENKHILLYLADGRTQHVGINIPYVNAVNEDFPFLDIEIAAYQVKDGGFPGSGCTYKCDFFSGTDRKADILQDIVLLLIGKPDMAEFDPALDLYVYRPGGLHDFRFLIQYGEDFFCGGQGGLQGSELLRQFLDGFKKGAYVADKNEQGAQGESALKHIGASRPNDDNHSQDGEHVNGRAEDGKGHDLSPVCLVQLLGFRFEGFVFFLLFGENLNQLHAGKMFGQEGVKLRNFVSGQLISLAGQRTEKEG